MYYDDTWTLWVIVVISTRNSNSYDINHTLGLQGPPGALEGRAQYLGTKLRAWAPRGSRGARSVLQEISYPYIPSLTYLELKGSEPWAPVLKVMYNGVTTVEKNRELRAHASGPLRLMIETCMTQYVLYYHSPPTLGI